MVKENELDLDEIARQLEQWVTQDKYGGNLDDVRQLLDESRKLGFSCRSHLRIARIQIDNMLKYRN
jgi:hypothetical protein